MVPAAPQPSCPCSLGTPVQLPPATGLSALWLSLPEGQEWGRTGLQGHVA